MPCASGSKLTPGRAVVSRWYERTRAIHCTADALAARSRPLRPTGKSDDVQILWWRHEAWATPGDFGPVIMPLNEALDFVATESFFWIGA